MCFSTSWTNLFSLDIQYQQQTLAIAKSLTKRVHMVISILHDINLAAQYADRIIMLKMAENGMMVQRQKYSTLKTCMRSLKWNLMSIQIPEH